MHKSSEDTALGTFSRNAARRAGRGPATARAVILTLVLFLVAAAVFAAVTPLRSVTRADGILVPVGRLHQVQSAGGGTVSEVFVTEGGKVAAGEALARLTKPDLSGEIAETEALLATVEAKRAALEALVMHFQPARPVKNAHTQMRPETYALVKARVDLEIAKRKAHETRLSEFETTIETLRRARDIERDRVTEYEAQLASLEALLADGHASRFRLHEARDRLGQLRGDLAEAEAELGGALSDRANARAGWQESDLAFQQEVLTELFDLQQEQERLHARLQYLQLQADDLTIRAPSAGTIQSVLFPAPGEVVTSGTTLFELMPEGAPLVAEIRLQPGDIGHVAVGATAHLRFRTYDYRKFGGMTGQITSLSPGRLTHEDGTEHFRATVVPESLEIGEGTLRRPLRAGMDVAVEIQSDSRTIAQYLIKPVDTAMRKAMTER